MNENKEFYKIPSFLETIFKDKVELLPSVNESFELELAYLEYHCLQLKIYELCLLAFLDSLRYSKKVVRSRHKQLSNHKEGHYA